MLSASPVTHNSYSIQIISPKFAVTFRRALIVAFILLIIFNKVGAQGVIINRSETYDTDGKIKVDKGANYKVETKGGKLHIRNKGKIQRMLTNIYSYLDAYKECYDFETKLEIKFIEGNESGAFGMEFYTYDSKRTTTYFNLIKFMFTGDGKLKFYSGADESMDIEKQSPEVCPSFKLTEVNTVEMIRKKMDWYLLVNKDTVKHVTETVLHPVVKLYTGNYMLYGNYEIELDNFTYVVRSDADEDDKKNKKLASLQGSYLTYSSCLKTTNKRTTLYLKQDPRIKTKFTLTGLGKDPITLYMDEREENVFSHYEIEAFSMAGETYNMRRLKVTQNGSGGIHNIAFNVFAQDSKTVTDCDFFGDQSYESIADNVKSAPDKSTPVNTAYTKKGKYIDGIALVQRDKKYGYIDESGKEIIPLTYEFAQEFSEGMAAVWEKEKYGFIDKAGKLIIPTIYDGTFLGFSNGLAAVRLNNKWGFIDKKGKIIIPINYEKVMLFREGVAPVRMNEKWGYIDTTGKIIIPMKFDRANGFNDGLAVVFLAGKYGCINKKGELIIPIIYDDTYGFTNGKIRMILSGKSLYFDKNGKAVAE